MKNNLKELNGFWMCAISEKRVVEQGEITAQV